MSVSVSCHDDQRLHALLTLCNLSGNERGGIRELGIKINSGEHQKTKIAKIGPSNEVQKETSQRGARTHDIQMNSETSSATLVIKSLTLYRLS